VHIPSQNCADGWAFTADRRAYEQDILGRFEDLLPNGKRKLPRPDWMTSPKSQKGIDWLTLELSYPSQWAVVALMFEFGGGMKTAEALQKIGPVGAYQLQFLDCSPRSVNAPY
jgi:hypothetical protein